MTRDKHTVDSKKMGAYFPGSRTHIKIRSFFHGFWPSDALLSLGSYLQRLLYTVKKMMLVINTIYLGPIINLKLLK